MSPAWLKFQNGNDTILKYLWGFLRGGVALWLWCL